MFARLGNAVLVLALVAAMGNHWAVLQSVAWTTMLASNLRSSSFQEAVASTFDGKHPCSLCKQIAAGRKAERKSQVVIQLKKLEFLTDTPQFSFAAPANFTLLISSDPIPNPLTLAPPTPPPRDVPA